MLSQRSIRMSKSRLELILDQHSLHGTGSSSKGSWPIFKLYRTRKSFLTKKILCFRLEISLRRIDPTVFIPYWDSRLDYRIPNPADSVLWHNDLYGYESADGQVRTGIFANWPYIDVWLSLHLREIGTLQNSRFYRRNRGASGSLLSPTEVNTVLAQTDFQQVLANTAPRQVDFPKNQTSSLRCAKECCTLARRRQKILKHAYISQQNG